MSLTSSLNTALSGLRTSSDQLSVTSRNTAAANQEGASRKIPKVTTLLGGGVQVALIERLANPQLLARLLGTTSDAGAQRVIADALKQFDVTINDPSLAGAPGSLLSKLDKTLQAYASAPQDSAAANAVINAARDLAQGLRDASQRVQEQRRLADQGMQGSVNNINDLLKQFQSLNDEIVRGTGNRNDITDLLDQRDMVVRKLSEEIGVRTVTDGNNNMAIFTDKGVTLFNGVPRPVTFESTSAFGATTTGKQVFIDGVAVTGGQSGLTSSTGKLVGHAKVRDEIAVVYQKQLDEVARGLVSAFAEKDQTGSGQPDRAGLFTWDGGPGVPGSAGVTDGLAAQIKLNPLVDPSKGGNANLLRDGGINGAAYVYNASNSSGFSGRLRGLMGELGAQRNFDGSAGITSNGSIAGFLSASGGWLQAQRKTAEAAATYSETLKHNASDALSKETGVNMDEEMTMMLQYERAYQASARVMTTVDQMFNTLLQMFRS